MAAKLVTTEPRHFAYIDAVRGLAFLAVLSNHVAKVDGRFPGWWIWNNGYYGVQFFFLASAITLCYSMESRKTKDKKPVVSFFIRRLFRIGPMYWLAIILYWGLPFECLRSDWLRPFSGETGPAPLDFGLNALFLHGWVPSAFNSVVPGGWSIGVEMTFYLIFPLLFYYLNSLNRAALAAAAGVLFATVYFRTLGPFLQANFYSDANSPWFFTQFCFPAQLTVFFIGMFAYHLLRSDNVKILTRNKTSSICLLIASLFFLALLFNGGGSGFVPIGILVVIGLTGVILALAGQTMPWLINPWLSYLGKISYSCYLVHFAALSLVFHYFKIDHSLLAQGDNNLSPLHNFIVYVKVMMAALVLTIVISTLTLHLIENPGIALGRRLINRLNKSP
jgi:peptidoglycan/LPS O-acetylase OafA/YrhL